MHVCHLDVYILCYMYVYERAGAVYGCLPVQQIRGCAADDGCLMYMVDLTFGGLAVGC